MTGIGCLGRGIEGLGRQRRVVEKRRKKKKNNKKNIGQSNKMGKANIASFIHPFKHSMQKWGFFCCQFYDLISLLSSHFSLTICLLLTENNINKQYLNK
jgi:hypothetical protein